MKSEVSEILADKGHGVIAVAPDATALDAVEAMNRAGIGAVIVLSGERPVGIFSERDVLVRIVARGRDAATTPVREVMTTELVTIEPSMTVREAMHIVTDRRCRHLPVVSDGKLHGLISIGDLTRWVVRDQKQHIATLEDYVLRG